MSGLGGLFDVVIINRWNIYLGIPDAVFFLLGDDIIHNVVDLCYWIPSSAIIGKVCPPHMEACTYAYLAGISNFGRMISVISGALITEVAGISTLNRRMRNSTSACNWDGLGYLVLGGHVILMLVVSIPASFLIPNVPQDADLLKPVQPVESEAELMSSGGDTSDIMLI